jgi:serine/threonine protein phosphatase PrpC
LHGDYQSTDQLVDYMRTVHKQLRAQYLHETASYIILIYDKNTKNGWVLHCGDCRFGLMQSDGINWLTNVHTLANADGNFFSASHYDDPKRHTVTRCLNAKRFIVPEIQKVDLPENVPWLLCTDGYWAEYKGKKKEWEQLSDDASCLKISNQLSQSYLCSDCKNCFNYFLGVMMTFTPDSD